jgi:hypothetical protein
LFLQFKVLSAVETQGDVFTHPDSDRHVKPVQGWELQAVKPESLDLHLVQLLCSTETFAGLLLSDLKSAKSRVVSMVTLGKMCPLKKISTVATIFLSGLIP